MESAVLAYEENGYSFVETSESWKQLCSALPCFAQVEWPDYRTAIVEDVIDGKPVVIQLWKGWCQQFLGRDDFPGGIGGEVGVYERVSGTGFPAERPDFLPESMWNLLKEMSKRANGDFWWPVKEKYEIEFDFINPITEQVMFHAGGESTYWLNKWMDTDSYDEYRHTQGKRWNWLPEWFPKNSQTPVLAEDYILSYKINGKQYPPFGEGAVVARPTNTQRDQEKETASMNNENNDAMPVDLPAEMFRSGTGAPEIAVLTIENINSGSVSSETIKFTEVDGLAMYQGDIVLGKADDIRNETDVKGLGIVGDYRWENGVMPYEIVDESVRARVLFAIKHWEAHTPIRFVERSDQDDYVTFEDKGGCYSMIGRQKGRQTISLGSGCSAGSAIHEIGHALGLFHEQSRGDRDNFITVVNANIDPQFKHNFDKHITDAIQLGGYDYGSIMHYPATAFSTNGQPTIIAKDGAPIGQRTGLSKTDIEAIKELYPDLDWTQYENDLEDDLPAGVNAG